MIIRFMKRYSFTNGHFYLPNFKINVENSLNFCLFDRNCQSMSTSINATMTS